LCAFQTAHNGGLSGQEIPFDLDLAYFAMQVVDDCLGAASP